MSTGLTANVVIDLALTSMARLWDVGRSEPIKVGKASPTEGTLPGAVYFILKYAEQEDILLDLSLGQGCCTWLEWRLALQRACLGVSS